MPSGDGQRISLRTEWLVLLFALLAGAILRCYHFSSVGLSHFDEGIYAISGLWPWTGAFEPYQGFYSPPLYPTLIGLVNLTLGGPSDISGAVVSLFFGLVTIPLAWWIGRTWWNPTTGLIAAWLVALDGVQVAFSLAGLTDMTFSFAFLASLFAIERALSRGGIWRVVVGGILVGFTWNIKYNGFLPLAVSFGFLWRERRLAALGRLAAMGLIGFLGYLPWALAFHQQHGYQALIHHQQGYLVGGSQILWNFPKAFFNWDLLEPGWVFLSLVVLGGIATIRRLWILVLLSLPALFFPLVPLPLLLAAGWGYWKQDASGQRFATGWLLGTMLLLPSLYTPYFRLWLPTETLLLLFAAHGLYSFILPRPSWDVRGLVGALPLAVPLLVVILIRVAVMPPVTTTGYRNAAQELVEWNRQHAGRLVLAARPPLRYYLATQTLPVEFSVANTLLGVDLDRSMLVVDRGLRDNPEMEQRVETLENEALLHQWAAFHVEPSQITILDDYAIDVLPPRSDRGVSSRYRVRILSSKPPPVEDE